MSAGAQTVNHETDAKQRGRSERNLMWAIEKDHPYRTAARFVCAVMLLVPVVVALVIVFK
jgi:hypothetical protein